MLSVLILAGGDSSRMGRTKALLDYRGRSFLEAVLEASSAAGAAETIVVLGGSRKEVLSVWEPGAAKVAFNETPELGQIASVRAGLRLVSAGAEAAMICLVDQPTILPGTYGAVAAFWRENKGSIIIPKCLRGGSAPPVFKRGHPVIIPRVYFPLCSAGPAEKGLHWVTHHPSARVLDLEVDDGNILRDFDTPEEYASLQTF